MLQSWPALTAAGCLFVTLGAACERGAKEPGAQSPVRFSIMGHLGSKTIHKEALALHTHLEQVLKQPVSVHLLEDYDQLQNHIGQAEVDFAILSPLTYVLVKKKIPELEPIARVVAAGSVSYEGALVANAGSGITDLAALAGKKVCWVSTSSTSGYLYPRVFLRQQGVDPDAVFASAQQTGGHVASLRALHAGECDVAATYSGALENAAAVGLSPDSFAIIEKTGQIPLDPVVARPGLEPETKKRLREALLAMDPATNNRLANVRSFLRWEGFIAVQDADYDVIRQALEKDRTSGE